MDSQTSKNVSMQELIDFLDAWEHVGQLQTFQSREKFRKEARFWIQRLELARDSAPEPPAEQPSVTEILRQMKGRAADSEGGTTIEVLLSDLRSVVTGMQLARPAPPPRTDHICWSLVDEYLQSHNLNNNDRGILRRFAGWVDTGRSRPTKEVNP
jgi:hypothetical protein